MSLAKDMIPSGVLLVAGAAALFFRPAANPASEDSRPVVPIRDSASRNPLRQKDHLHHISDPALREALKTLAQASELENQRTLEKITSSWPRQNMKGALVELFGNSAGDPPSEWLRVTLLERWTKLEPAVAAAWAACVQESPGRESAVTQVALTWSAIDPVAAWEWAHGLPRDPARESALLSLGYELSREDPASALKRSESLQDGPDRNHLIEHAIARLATTDPEAALEATRSLTDPDLRNNAFAGLVTSWAESDPLAAASFAVDGMDQGPAQDRAIIAVVQRWAQKSPDEASAWVSGFPDGPLKDNALSRIAELSATQPDPVE